MDAQDKFLPSIQEELEKPTRTTENNTILLTALEAIQTAVNMHGLLYELDPALYLPTLENWRQKYPQFEDILSKMTIQINEHFVQNSEFPPFVIGFFRGIFEELDMMVNGGSMNHLIEIGFFL